MSNELVVQKTAIYVKMHIKIYGKIATLNLICIENKIYCFILYLY